MICCQRPLSQFRVNKWIKTSYLKQINQIWNTQHIQTIESTIQTVEKDKRNGLINTVIDTPRAKSDACTTTSTSTPQLILTRTSTSASDVRLRTLLPTPATDLRRPPPTSATSATDLHRPPLPISATDLHYRSPLTSAIDLRRPPPLSPQWCECTNI